MKCPTNIEHMPEGATHWAPETDNWLEGWYRLEDGLWYHVNQYWASDVDERPYGMPADAWKNKGSPVLTRPLWDLVEIKDLTK